MSQRVQIKINLRPDLAERLDRERGDLSRSALIETALAERWGADPPASARPRASRPSRREKAGDGTPPPALEPSYLTIGSFDWADMDDPMQRTCAIVAWETQRPNFMPQPFPFSSKRGEDPASVDIEKLLTDASDYSQAWAWVDGYVR